MIRSRTNHADLDAVLRVPPSKTIEAVNAVADAEVVQGPLADRPVRLWVEWNVGRTPPDVFFGGGILDDAFVLGGTASFLSRVRDQSAILCNSRLFFVTYCMFVQNTGREIAVDFLHV